MVKVTKEALDKGSRAALANAQRLLRDAERLLRDASAPTAHSLAVLAMEEAAKAVTWRQKVDEAPAETLNLRRDKDHVARLQKVRRALSYLEIFWNVHHDPDYAPPADEAWLTAIQAQAGSDNTTKQQGFYVDVEGDHVMEPTRIQEQEARQAIETARHMIGLARVLLEGSPA